MCAASPVHCVTSRGARSLLHAGEFGLFASQAKPPSHVGMELFLRCCCLSIDAVVLKRQLAGELASMRLRAT